MYEYHLMQWIVILLLSMYQLSIFKASPLPHTFPRHADALQDPIVPDSFCSFAMRAKHLREATTSLVLRLAYTIRF